MKKFVIILSEILVSIVGYIFVDRYVFVLQTCKPTNFINQIFKINLKCSSRLYYPTGLAFDSHGNLFVVDSGNHVIRKLSVDGTVSVYAGSFGRRGHENGSLLKASFMAPAGITIDNDDNIYVADQGNDLIRKIDRNGKVSTFAGIPKIKGLIDGPKVKGNFNSPIELEFNNKNELIILDIGNNAIRSIDQHGYLSTLFGDQNHRACDNLKKCYLNGPAGLTINKKNEIFVADAYNHVIRKISDRRKIYVYSGTPAKIGTRNGNSRSVQYKTPNDVAIGENGELFVLDSGNGLIRKIDIEGEVFTIKLQSKNKKNNTAQLHHPRNFIYKKPHFLYISDTGDHTVKKVDLTTGQIEIILGVSGKRGRANGNRIHVN